MSKESIRKVLNLYEQKYKYRQEAAAFCFWYIIIHYKGDINYLHRFLNRLMHNCTPSNEYFTEAEINEIIKAQERDVKELRKIWRILIYDLSEFEYDSFQAIISVDELLDSLEIESVWHFDLPIELFGSYKHILDMKEIDSQPPSRDN